MGSDGVRYDRNRSRIKPNICSVKRWAAIRLFKPNSSGVTTERRRPSLELQASDGADDLRSSPVCQRTLGPLGPSGAGASRRNSDHSRHSSSITSWSRQSRMSAQFTSWRRFGCLFWPRSSRWIVFRLSPVRFASSICVTPRVRRTRASFVLAPDFSRSAPAITPAYEIRRARSRLPPAVSNCARMRSWDSCAVVLRGTSPRHGRARSCDLLIWTGAVAYAAPRASRVAQPTSSRSEKNLATRGSHRSS